MNEKEIPLKEHKSSKMKTLNQSIKTIPEILIRPEKEIKGNLTERDKDSFEKEGITWR